MIFNIQTIASCSHKIHHEQIDIMHVSTCYEIALNVNVIFIAQYC